MAEREKRSMEAIVDSPEGVEEITAASTEGYVPGLDWALSEESERALREVDANLRAAEQMSGRLLAG